MPRAARRGLRVVFVGSLPDRDTSLARAEDDDRRVRAAMRRLTALPTVARVPEQADVRAALADLDVAPAARWSQDQPVYSHYRRGNGVDYWYLWNSGETAAEFTGSFATAGTPYEMDLWTGDIRRVGEYRVSDAASHSQGAVFDARDSGARRVSVPLKLAPGETTVLAFRHGEGRRLHAVASDAEKIRTVSGGLEVRDTRPGTHTVQVSDGSTRTVTIPELPAPMHPKSWRLRVDEVGPDGTTTHRMRLSELEDWRDIPEIRRASGTGTYTTELTVPRSWLSERRGAYLVDIEEVYGVMQVFVNGTRVAPDISVDQPYADRPLAVAAARKRFNVTSLLQPGRNRVRIVLTTTLKNKIVGLWQSGRGGPPTGAAQPATQPYGVLDPVALVPYGRAGVSR